MGLNQVDVGNCGDMALLYVLVVAYICIYADKRVCLIYWVADGFTSDSE